MKLDIPANNPVFYAGCTARTVIQCKDGRVHRHCTDLTCGCIVKEIENPSLSLGPLEMIKKKPISSIPVPLGRPTPQRTFGRQEFMRVGELSFLVGNKSSTAQRRCCASNWIWPQLPCNVLLMLLKP